MKSNSFQDTNTRFELTRTKITYTLWYLVKSPAGLSGREQSLLYRPRRAPADPREIMAQSSASYPFIPFPPPGRECVIILKDNSINGTKEEIHALNT
jgi:hypothetical protein